MKKLDTKVNVIPIIAKADTISKSELQKFKVNYSQYKILSIMLSTIVIFFMVISYWFNIIIKSNHKPKNKQNYIFSNIF